MLRGAFARELPARETTGVDSATRKLGSLSYIALYVWVPEDTALAAIIFSDACNGVHLWAKTQQIRAAQPGCEWPDFQCQFAIMPEMSCTRLI
jgi:hypothetical protein